MSEGRKGRERLSKSAATGAVALIFMIIGFQAALFMVKVIERPAAQADDRSGGAGQPGEAGQSGGAGQSGEALCSAGDYDSSSAGSNYKKYSSSSKPYNSSYRPYNAEGGNKSSRYGGRNGGKRYSGRDGYGGTSGYNGGRGNSDSRGRADALAKGGYYDSRDYDSSAREKSRGGYKPFERRKRLYESFRFNPNTVSLEELQRLGLSARQAQVIDNYRNSGGKFRSREDFRRMYVVSDTLYARLEPFIDIPRIDLNSADSASLVTLRGIGPYYARKIIAYRTRLGGFFDIGQLLEIDGIDEEKFDGLSSGVRADTALIEELKIWTQPVETLARHPYIGSYAAKGIVRYRQVCDSSQWTLASLVSNGIISEDAASRLRHYVRR